MEFDLSGQRKADTEEESFRTVHRRHTDGSQKPAHRKAHDRSQVIERQKSDGAQTDTRAEMKHPYPTPPVAGSDAASDPLFSEKKKTT